jgi:hypothetical protein
MRFAITALLILSMLALAGCESKSQKADRMMREFIAAHPDYQQKCAPLYRGTLGYPDIKSPYASLTKVTPEEKAAYEAKVKARQAECKPLDEQYDKLLLAKSQTMNAQAQH